MLLLLTLPITGCGTWSKPGATKGDFQRDKQACKEQERREYPVTTQNVFVRNDTVCRTNVIGTRTTCSTYPVYQKVTTGTHAPWGYATNCWRSRGWRHSDD